MLSYSFLKNLIMILLQLADCFFKFSFVLISLLSLLEQLFGERLNTNVLFEQLLSQSSKLLLNEMIVFLTIG